MDIPFHVPTVTGRERAHLEELLSLPGAITSDGRYTRLCSAALESQLGLRNVLFTPSCTASLEMAALLSVRPGDEVIVPSFTFVTSVSSFVRAGAKPVFCDIRPDTLNLDQDMLADLVTPRTRAIVAVHYAGVACDMDTVCASARRSGAIVVEDAAQALTGRYNGAALGSIGELACFSFHSTKNYHCGEGGALVVNAPDLIARAEIIREKGTNRRAFMRGQADKYTWVDVGSSYVPGELGLAFLAGQVDDLEPVRSRRQQIYEAYIERLQPLFDDGSLVAPSIPAGCESSYHLFHVLAESEDARNALLGHLTGQGIGATFHYVPLHSSPFGRALHDGRPLPVTESVAGRLLRLPLYPELTDEQQQRVCAAVLGFYGRQS